MGTESKALLRSRRAIATKWPHIMPFGSYLHIYPGLHKSDWPGRQTVQVVGSDCLDFEILDDGAG